MTCTMIMNLIPPAKTIKQNSEFCIATNKYAELKVKKFRKTI